MSMDDAAAGLIDGTRDLDMEVLCSIPPAGNRLDRAGRKVWSDGVSMTELAKDLQVDSAVVRESVQRLSEKYALNTGIVAPLRLAGGEILLGGHCAMVLRNGWEKVKLACEFYWNANVCASDSSLMAVGSASSG